LPLNIRSLDKKAPGTEFPQNLQLGRGANAENLLEEKGRLVLLLSVEKEDSPWGLP